MEKEELRLTWQNIESRHIGINIRNEWDKYVRWLRKKNIWIKPSIKTLLIFERSWLNSLNVTRNNNPEAFKEKEKEISPADIKKISDLLSKRRLQTTENEIKELLKYVSVTAIELWYQNGMMPKNPAFKQFLISKNRY